MTTPLLSRSEKIMITRAAHRWGMKSPSSDDILMRKTKRYHKSEKQTEAYHRMANALIRRMKR